MANDDRNSTTDGLPLDPAARRAAVERQFDPFHERLAALDRSDDTRVPDDAPTDDRRH